MNYSAWLVPWDIVDSSETAAGFDELHPFAFALSSAPAPFLAYPEFLEASSAFRRKGTLFVPAVVNDVVEGGKVKALKSEAALSALLYEPKAAEAHAEDLVRLAKDFDGIEIDYERIPARLWPRFADFIESLGRRLHAEGKRLCVDLEPERFYKPDMIRRYGPRLARAADEINLMAYYGRGRLSLHPAASDSLAWVVETSSRALESIPHEKLAVVLSLAGTDWEASLPGPASPWRGRRLHYGQVQELLSKTGAETNWDADSRTPYFRYTRDGRRHELWFEDERSLSEKVAALRGIGVGRIGFWYWGRRHPNFNTATSTRH